MSYVASELRRLRRDNARLNRRLATLRMPGKVVERDGTTRRVRLDLGTDPETGKTVLSPWVRVQSSSAGAVKGFVLPSIGEQLYLMNASGTIGADSVATFGTFDDGDNPPPAQDADEAVIFERGTTRLSASAAGFVLKVGDHVHRFTGAGTAITGGKITHDEKNIGGDHKHRDVQSGGAQSGPPV